MSLKLVLERLDNLISQLEEQYLFLRNQHDRTIADDELNFYKAIRRLLTDK